MTPTDTVTVEPVPVAPSPAVPQADTRLTRLQHFLENENCPVASLAHEFLRASDRNRLDWRLLPSLAVIESGGGRDYRRNNIFGWNNGKARFDSVEDGIHTVADRLATMTCYRGKSLEELLWAYNPIGNFVERVKTMMARVGPPSAIPDGAELRYAQ